MGYRNGKGNYSFPHHTGNSSDFTLRKNFKPVQLLQVPVGVVFGYFTTFCNYMVSFLPTPENLAIRIFMVLLSTVFVAFGIFLYLPADLIPLAGEGCMQAVSSVTRIEFSKVKIGFDCTMVVVSAVTCLGAYIALAVLV